jgi:hypothetical protein
MSKKTPNLSLGERVILRDILGVIIEDDELRKGFRQACVVTTPELNRLWKKLNRAISDQLDSIDKLPG